VSTNLRSGISGFSGYVLSLLGIGFCCWTNVTFLLHLLQLLKLYKFGIGNKFSIKVSMVAVRWHGKALLPLRHF